MNHIYLVLTAFFLVCGCDFNESSELDLRLEQKNIKNYQGNLENIKSHKVLRVLTTENNFNYFVYKGKEAGYEYEILKNFVNFLNSKWDFKNPIEKIKLKMIPVRYDELFYLLNRGYGDIVAAGTTITDGRKNIADFSNPYNNVSELLISHEDHPVEGYSDLAGKKVYLRKSSSYYDSVNTLNKNIIENGFKPLQIFYVDEALNTENIIEMVSLGKYDLTVADAHIAQVSQKIFGNLSLSSKVILNEKREIAWALNKESQELKKLINEFLPNYSRGSLYGNINLKRYYENIPHLKNRFLSVEKKQLSPYDEIFKKYGTKYGWDWKLLAALAYQESRFKQNIKNRWGAIGVMQIKQEVANEPYVAINEIEGKNNYEQNIHAGVKYLSWIKETFFEQEEISEKAKIHLSLAAYNAGPSRLNKARKLAEEMQHNPNKWFGELEYVLLKMDKLEPVKYVDDIHRRSTAYDLIIEGS